MWGEVLAGVKREKVGPVPAPGHLAPGRLFTCVVDPRLELRKSLRNPRGSRRWLTRAVAWVCQAPKASAPEPRKASAPSEERGLLTPAWPQAGHPRYSPERTPEEMPPPFPWNCGELLPLGPPQNG